jgi:hypothetical protein
MVVAMPGHSAGEPSGGNRAANTQFLIHVVAAALLLAGLLLRFGMHCPDGPAGSHEHRITARTAVSTATQNVPHIGQNTADSQCERQNTHTRFVAPSAAGPMFALGLLMICALFLAMASSVRRTVRPTAPRAPPKASIVFCVRLI